METGHSITHIFLTDNALLLGATEKDIMRLQHAEQSCPSASGWL